MTTDSEMIIDAENQLESHCMCLISLIEYLQNKYGITKEKAQRIAFMAE